MTHWECHGLGRRLIVPANEEDTLNELYYKNVVHGVGQSNKRATSYLVERPFTHGDPAAAGVLAVDIDIKIDSTVYRDHAASHRWPALAHPTTNAQGQTVMPHMVDRERHIVPFVQAQLVELQRLVCFGDRNVVRVFVLQKSKAKAVTEPLSGGGGGGSQSSATTSVPTTVFSDGIHMFVSVALTMQQHNWMYERMCAWIRRHWLNPQSPFFLPGLTFDEKNILDKGIYAGNTAVLKYGARKGQDAAMAYTMTSFYQYEYAPGVGGDPLEKDPLLVPTDANDFRWTDKALPHQRLAGGSATAQADHNDAHMMTADSDNEDNDVEEESTTARSSRNSSNGGNGTRHFGKWRLTATAADKRAEIRDLECRWFHLLSVRARKDVLSFFEVRPELRQAFQAMVDRDGQRFARKAATNDDMRAIGGTDAKAVHRAQLADFLPEALLDVQTTDDVVRFMEIFRASINPNDEATSLLLSYLFNLPEEFYAKGCYTKRNNVGFALHSYSSKLLVVYIAFCAQRDDFDFRAKVPMLVEKWQSYSKPNVAGGRKGISHHSIPYWCKDAAPDAYNRIRISSFDVQLDLMLSTLTMGNISKRNGATTSGTDVDKARLAARIAAGRYVCADITNNVWYEFRDQRWREIQQGYTLRTMISDELLDCCMTRVHALNERYLVCKAADPDSENTEIACKRVNIALAIAESLKCTKTLDNVLKELRNRLFDSEFLNRLDANQYLMGFTNGVYDMNEHVLREGQPDDYISFSVGYAYVPLEDQPPELVAEYDAYLRSLFPVPEMCDYMRDHIMFSFIADGSINQNMHWYTGGGNNGKSYFLVFMQLVHGERAAMLKSSFYTERSGGLGKVSEELYATIHKAFVYSDETAENAVLQDCQMKQVTSGTTKVEARKMYKPPRQFTPGATHVLATNNLLDVQATDEGVWRRIVLVDFMVYYTNNPRANNQPSDDGEDHHQQYQAKGRSKDEMKALIERIYTVVVSVSMDRLKKRVAATGSIGKLVQPPRIANATLAFRKSQDLVGAFIAERTEEDSSTKVISHNEMKELFAQWVQAEFLDQSVAKNKRAEMIKRTGAKYKNTANRKGFYNMRIKYDDNSTNNFGAAASLFGGGNGNGSSSGGSIGRRRSFEDVEEDDEEEVASVAHGGGSNRSHQSSSSSRQVEKRIRFN